MREWGPVCQFFLLFFLFVHFFVVVAVCLFVHLLSFFWRGGAICTTSKLVMHEKRVPNS